MDERAQAHGIIVFFAMLLTGALLYTLFQPAVNGLLDAMVQQSSSQQATDVINERREIWGLILFYVVFVSGLFLIARSVLQSRSPG